MIKLTENAGRVIADEMMQTFAATEAAMLIGLRVTSSVIEGTGDAGIHPRTKQKLLESLHDGLGGLLQGRRALVESHSQMTIIQRNSNLVEVDYGCVGGPHEGEERRGFFSTGSLKTAPLPAVTD